MRLIYSGPHPEFVIDELNSDRVLRAGEPFNVPDELGARLLEQDTYQESLDDQSAAGRARLDQANETPAADDGEDS